MNIDLIEAFLSFCENLIDSVSGIQDEAFALSILKRRFITWKTLFQKASQPDISKEKALGVFGELLVLRNIIAPKYGINTAVQSWGGPNMQSKDFTVDETWYEVKTIGSNSDSIHISSLTQLFSEYSGHLAVVRAETVSPEFKGDCSAIIDLIEDILLMISDEDVENLFTAKIHALGIDVLGSEISYRFDVKNISLYRVDDRFPKLTPQNIPFSEIVGAKYEISTASIGQFEEE